MLFSRTIPYSIFALASTLLCVSASPVPQGGPGSPSATEGQAIVSAIQDITTLSANLKTTAQSINLVNAIFVGPQLAPGFGAIINRVGQAVTMLSDPSMVTLDDVDAVPVVNALTTFVQVHQALLNVVIGKHGVLTLIPFFEPIRQSLVSLESAVDSVAFALIALIPTQAPAATVQFGALGATVTQAIDTYSTLV